ncbi:Suppressor of fused protein (SUFU) [Actinacidiphila glaucinigra]|uniref:Suppressor of fused protein (SUFU) n=2 Tax=Actinacidiphila glaucinigra TaxID=235986 RepID=A0A238ZZN7_9ACTN|nr:Suppressor of fused protein (SUFU) [Actinacidiphila glaucinigra]
MILAMTTSEAHQALDRHVREFFAGHPVGTAAHDLGDGRRGTVPDLRVIEVGPGPRGDHWTYVTAGCWSRGARDGHGVEFVLTAPVPDPRFADLIAMTAHYHCGPRPHPLDVGHSLPVGEPWVPGSACDHILVSLPYLHGPDLEVCHLPDGHARLLWLLPVTSSEIAFRREHGTEALERRFDEAGIRPLDLHRAPVV